jgi:hypothetical protein
VDGDAVLIFWDVGLVSVLLGGAGGLGGEGSGDAENGDSGGAFMGGLRRCLDLLDGDGGEGGDAKGFGVDGRTGESDEVGMGGRDDLGVSRSAFLTDAEDQMMGIDVGAVTADGAVSCDFGGGEGLDCGDCGEEGVAAIRAESSVIIVDTNAFTSCEE